MPEEEHEQHHAHEDHPDDVHLLQKQMDVMEIKLGKFQFLNLSTTVKTNGVLELPPQNKASISAVMGGRVKSISILQGDYVKQGQVLAYLEDPAYADLQQEYLTAKSKLGYLQEEFERKKNLHQDSIGSNKSYREAEANYSAAKAQTNGLKAKLKLLDLNIEEVEQGLFPTAAPIRSPINGYVRKIEVNLGKYVNPEQELFEIVDNEHIHIDLRVYEKDMHLVHEGQQVVFSLTHQPDSVFQGTIFSVGKSFEEEPKAMLVHAEIDNKTGGLLPGMYVDARIITNSDQVQALPNDAVIRDGGLSYIFVLKPAASDVGHEDEYVFRKIEVNTGVRDIGFTEVIPVYDLPPKTQYVTQGAFYLEAELKKGSGGHGHHH